MARPPGAVSQDHEARRAALATRALRRLSAPDGATLSLRALAEALEVSRPTLLHYFGSLEGVIQAALEQATQQHARLLQQIASASLGPPQQALPRLLDALCDGWPRGLGAIHRLALLRGLSTPPLGETCLDAVLEPLLQAFAARLQLHIARRELSADLPPRQGALSLVAPILLALLHQHDLPGDRLYPLDLAALCRLQGEAFLRAWPPLTPAPLPTTPPR